MSLEVGSQKLLNSVQSEELGNRVELVRQNMLERQNMQGKPIISLSSNDYASWLYQKAHSAYGVAYRSYTLKHGYFRTISLMVIFITLVLFRKRSCP